MQAYHLCRGQSPTPVPIPDAMPAEGYLWIDVLREDESGWQKLPQRLLGVELDRRHAADGMEEAHKAFFDVTDHYDLLVVEELAPAEPIAEVPACAIAMFLFPRLLVTVRSAVHNLSVNQLLARFANGSVRAPAGERVLAEILLDQICDRLLGEGELFNQRLEDLQESLLDPGSPFKDWQTLLSGRRDAYRLEALCKRQLKALERWHRHSRFEWSNPEETRLHDICEHIGRMRDAAADLERHIEAAVQIHFAATTHRTNEVVRTLTVFSAIFLPLTFLAGVYGMNFVAMPELHFRLGYPLLLTVMVVVAIGLLRYFRRKGFL